MYVIIKCYNQIVSLEKEDKLIIISKIRIINKDY